MRKQRDPAREAAADARELDALRELASDAYELRSAIYVAEAVEKATMRHAEDPGLQRDGFIVFALTPEEEAARQFALHHLGDLARQLLAAFDGIEADRKAA